MQLSGLRRFLRGLCPFLIIVDLGIAQEPKTVQDFGRLPLYFESNQGQLPSEIRFSSRTSGGRLFLEDAAIDIAAAGGERVRISWGGKGGASQPGAEIPLETKVNYFIGSDPKRWRTNVPTFGRVRYESAFPGTDLVFYGNARQFEYDVVLQPGADPDQIAFEFEGAKKLEISTTGDLLLHTERGDIVQRKPAIFQEHEGKRIPVEGGYVLLAENRIGFKTEARDQNLPLVIDPVLDYSLLFGGSHIGDLGRSIAVDAGGNAYITGITMSNDFSLAGTPFQNQKQPMATVPFVAKLNPAGTALVYCTYLGGSVNDISVAIAVDANGNAYVAGQTFSSDFPVTAGAYKTNFTGNDNVFVTKLNPAGSALVYSTYIASTNSVTPSALAVDSAGAAYVTGLTYLLGYPLTPGAFDGTFHATNGPITFITPIGFVTKLAADGSQLVYSAYLGPETSPYAITLDSSKNAYIAGFAGRNLPVTPGVYQTQPNTTFAPGDAFVCELNASGSALVFATYLGGSRSDYATGIARDSSGNIYVTGGTDSTDFPVTAGAFQTTGGYSQVFVTKLNPTGSTVLYSSLYGDAGSNGSLNGQFSTGIVVDSAGNATIAGGFSIDQPFNAPFTHPLANPVQSVPTALVNSSNNSGNNAFSAKFNGAGGLVYSTFLGGDVANSIAMDAAGSIYVAGGGSRLDPSGSKFPVTLDANAANLNHGGVFVAKLTDPSPCSFSISPDSVVLPGTASSTMVNVTASAPTCNWVTASDQTWISHTSGKGSGTATINVDAITGSARNGKVSVAGQVFTISQPLNCATSVTPMSSTMVDASGGTFLATVNGPMGCLVLASSDAPSWLKILSTSQPPSGNLVYSVIPNSGAARSGTITVSGQSLTINQAAGTCDYSLDASSVQVSAEAQTGFFNVVTQCQFSAASNTSWISVPLNFASNTGPASVAFNVGQNPGPLRKGTITIAGQVVTVVQSGFGALDPPNGGFENGTIFPWTVFGGTSAAVTGYIVANGTYSLGESGGAGGVYRDLAGLTPGQYYHVLARVGGLQGGTTSAALWVHDGLGANAVIDGYRVPLYPNGNIWPVFEVNFQADATGKMRIHLLSSGGSSAIYWDTIQVSAGWQADFENSLAPWVPFGAATTNPFYATGLQTGGNGGIYQDVAGLTAGELYHIRVRAHSANETSGQAVLFVHDTEGANALADGPRLASTGWDEFAVNFIATTTEKVRIHLIFTGGTGSVTFDDLILTPGWLGGFENGTVAPWLQFGSGAVAINGSVADNSLFSLATSGGSGGAYQELNGLVPGQFYNVSARAHSASGTSSPALVFVHDTTGASAVFDGARVPSSSNWDLFSTNFAATNTGKMRIHLIDNGGSGTVYWDDVTVHQGAQESFESGTLGLWQVGGAVAATVSTAAAHTGTYSLSVSGGNGVVYRDIGGLQAGQYYRVTIHARAAAGTAGQATLYVHDTAGGSGAADGSRTPASSGWDEFELNFLATGTGQIRLHLIYSGGAGTIYFDDLQILKAWGGGFENGTVSPWQALGGTTLSVTSARAYDGASSLSESGAGGGVYADVTNLTPGQLYQITARAQSSGGSSKGVLFVHDGSGANAAADGYRAPSPSDWDEFKVKFTATGGGKVRLHLLSDGGSGAIFWDEITVLPILQ